MNNKCFLCKGPIVWQNDFDFVDYCYDGDGIVSVYICCKCGAEYNVIQDFNNEEEKDE